MVHHGRLHGVKRIALRQSLDGDQQASMQLAHQHDAGIGGGPHKRAVTLFRDGDRAGPAIALGAAFLRAREAAVQPQPLEHGLVGRRRDGDLVRTIDEETNVGAHGWTLRQEADRCNARDFAALLIWIGCCRRQGAYVRSIMIETDVVVIGAGSAGIAALRACLAGGAPAVGIEARSRPGGRAHTVDGGGFPVDLGCGWLHSADRNPLVPIARSLGFEIDERAPPWRDSGRALGFAPANTPPFGPRRPLSTTGGRSGGGPGDTAAARWLEPGGRWNPLIDAVSTYVNGVELDRYRPRIS